MPVDAKDDADQDSGKWQNLISLWSHKCQDNLWLLIPSATT